MSPKDRKHDLEERERVYALALAQLDIRIANAEQCLEVTKSKDGGELCRMQLDADTEEVWAALNLSRRKGAAEKAARRRHELEDDIWSSQAVFEAARNQQLGVFSRDVSAVRAEETRSLLLQASTEAEIAHVSATAESQSRRRNQAVCAALEAEIAESDARATKARVEGASYEASYEASMRLRHHPESVRLDQAIYHARQQKDLNEELLRAAQYQFAQTEADIRQRVADIDNTMEGRKAWRSSEETSY